MSRYSKSDKDIYMEVLKPSMGAGAYIKDFRKSDAPQFKGKTEKERDKMAIAAYLDAKDEMSETKLPPHLAKMFDKDGNFKDKKKQAMFDKMQKAAKKGIKFTSKDVTPKGFGPDEGIEEKKMPSMQALFALIADTKNAQEGITKIMKALKVDEKKASSIMDKIIAAALKKEELENEGFASDAQRRAAFAQGYKAKGKDKKKDEQIQEDGHTDVSSAIRQCKTIVEDAMQITSKLQTMNPEDSLPSWWTNKLAVSSNSMNKLRDYFLVPTTEEVELEEAFKKGDKVTVNVAKSSDRELQQLSKKFGDTVSGVVIGQTGKIVMVKTDKGQINPFVKDVMKEEVELEESDIRGEISQLQKMLKGLERGKKTPGRGFAKMRVKELIADLEKRQAQDDAVMKLRGEEIEHCLDCGCDPCNCEKEEQMDEAIKYTYVAVDDKGKIIGFSGGSRAAADAKDMARRNNGVVHKLKKPMATKVGDKEINKPFNPVLKAEVEEDTIEESAMLNLATVKFQAKEKLGKIRHKVTQKGRKYIISVDSNDEEDAQKAMKDHPLYAAGKLRVVPESFYTKVTGLDSLKESRAKRDAMRAMGRRRGKDPADVDTDATDDDVKAASKNIIMQLRKSVSMKGNFEVEFEKEKKKVPANIAQAALDKHARIRTSLDKGAFDKKIRKSYRDLLNALKEK